MSFLPKVLGKNQKGLSKFRVDFFFGGGDWIYPLLCLFLPTWPTISRRPYSRLFLGRKMKISWGVWPLMTQCTNLEKHSEVGFHHATVIPEQMIKHRFHFHQVLEEHILHLLVVPRELLTKLFICLFEKGNFKRRHPHKCVPGRTTRHQTVGR